MLPEAVQVALVTTTGPLAIALITMRRVGRNGSKSLAHGLAKMNERLGRIEGRLGGIEGRQADCEQRIGRIEAKVCQGP